MITGRLRGAPKKSLCKRGHPRIPENLTPQGECKACRSANVHARRSWDSETRRAWKRKNYQANKRKESARQKKWRKSNPEKSRLQSQRARKARPEKYREIRRASDHKREAAKRGNGGSFTPQQWRELKVLYGHKCLCCGRSEEVLNSLGLTLVPDHIIPISKGGTSNIDNIQPLCHASSLRAPVGCNNTKHTQSTDYRKVSDTTKNSRELR